MSSCSALVEKHSHHRYSVFASTDSSGKSFEEHLTSSQWSLDTNYPQRCSSGTGSSAEKTRMLLPWRSKISARVASRKHNPHWNRKRMATRSHRHFKMQWTKIIQYGHISRSAVPMKQAPSEKKHIRSQKPLFLHMTLMTIHTIPQKMCRKWQIKLCMRCQLNLHVKTTQLEPEGKVPVRFQDYCMNWS